MRWSRSGSRGRAWLTRVCTCDQHVLAVLYLLANLNHSHMLVQSPTTAALKLPIMSYTLGSFCAWHLCRTGGGELPTTVTPTSWAIIITDLSPQRLMGAMLSHGSRDFSPITALLGRNFLLHFTMKNLRAREVK